MRDRGQGAWEENEKKEQKEKIDKAENYESRSTESGGRM